MSEYLHLILDRIQTPIGEMEIIADHDGNVRAVDWVEYEPRMLRLLRRHYGENGFRMEPGKKPTRIHGRNPSLFCRRPCRTRYFAGRNSGYSIPAYRLARAQGHSLRNDG